MAEVREEPAQRRASPARQILTLFGDYWWGVDEALPTGAILAALADLGVKNAAGRAALARLNRNGLLEVERQGRRTSHRLGGLGVEMIGEQEAWLESFGRTDIAWDGCWSVIAFSIPESDRARRHTARSKLRWLGYAPLYDGVWISPLDTAATVVDVLTSAGVQDVTATRGALAMTDPEGPMRAWDLAGVQQGYLQFQEELAQLPDAMDPPLALRERTHLILEWQSFRVRDAGQPAELLVDGWPRAAVRRRFAQRYNGWGPAAEARMRAHVGAIAPELTQTVAQRRLALD